MQSILEAEQAHNLTELEKIANQLSEENLNIKKFDRAYFIGVGGSGMSARERYFKNRGVTV